MAAEWILKARTLNFPQLKTGGQQSGGLRVQNPEAFDISHCLKDSDSGYRCLGKNEQNFGGEEM